MSLLTWSKTQWFLFGKLFAMKCVLDSPMSLSAQVWEHTVDSWPGNPSLKNTLHTITVSAAWGHSCLPCTHTERFLLRVTAPRLLRGFAGCPTAPRAFCWRHSGPGARGWCRILWDLPAPASAKSTRAQQRGGHRAHRHCREAGRQLPLPLRTRKAMEVKASTEEENTVRGSERKFHPMKERTETQVLDITVNCTKLIPHKKQMKTAANGQWPDMETTHGHFYFFPIKSLHSQYLNGKVKEGKALPCSGSFYGTQTTVHAVILGFCASLLFRGGFVQCWGVAGCSGGRLLSACSASPSQAAGRGLLGSLASERWSCFRGNFRAEWKTV